jgi:Zn-dependent M28 family amino/carboxypeptidase
MSFNHWIAFFSPLLFICIQSSCISPEAQGRLDGAIKIERLRTHVQVLSNDAMEGRAPGTPGGQLAAKYIAEQFRKAGLSPAVGDSSYFQNVTLMGVTHHPTLNFRIRNKGWELNAGEQFVGCTKLDTPAVVLRNLDVVFMGYGIDALEYNWNDYAGVEVTGKALLMLVNEPPSEDSTFFAGPALTYYGRWSYKYEEAARKGAAAVILIHTTPLAGYGWNVIQNSRSKEQFYVKNLPGNLLLSLESWITQEVAEKIFQESGFDFSELLAQAGSRGFRPVMLPLRVSAAINNTIRIVESPNVIAMLPGSDSVLKEQCIIYTAHYDHLGKNDALPEDNIYNGAFDNASGTATVIEIAREFSSLPFNPKRTILFAAVTAEESGLLGSQFYTQQPLWPLAKTAANLNLDGVNPWGKTYDIVPRGAERSTILEAAKQVAIEMQVKLAPDPMPEQGLFFRSDQFSLVKVGVPAVFITAGFNYVGKPPDWGKQIMDEYIQQRYHGVDDEYDPAWSLEGTKQVGQFALRLGLYLANNDTMPEWNAGEAFKRVREQSLRFSTQN